MSDREEIKAKLEELGIEYDGRMSTENLMALLNESNLGEPAPVRKTATATDPKQRPFRVLRDFWPTDNQEDRVRKGSIVEMTAEQAIDGISSGALEKAY